MDAHDVPIKHFELQMTQLYTTQTSGQPGTLPRNTIQNTKNDGHCIAVNTRGGNQTIDPRIPSVVEGYMRNNDDVT